MSRVHVRVRVGTEAYAFPVEHVLEIAEIGDVGPVPGAVQGALGVRNLRGEVLPVFELAALLGVAGDGPPARLLVTEHGGRKAGFAIHEVTDVGLLPEAVEEVESELLERGVLVDGELVGVVDIKRVFSALMR